MEGIASRLLKGLQALKPYRTLARRILNRGVSFRLATPGEKLELLSTQYLSDETRQSPHEAAASKDGQFILVADCSGETTGSAILQHHDPDAELYPGWWLFGMRVRLPYRGAGVGEGLTRLALELASENGAERLNLLVFEDNHPAKALYRKMGFRPYSLPRLEGELETEFQHGKRRRIILSQPLLTS